MDMQIGSVAETLSRMDVPGDLVAQKLAMAQISMLRRANQVQAELVKTLMDGIGGKLDVRG